MRTRHGRSRARSKQRGSALVEFCLCIGLVWMPLFLGTCEFGIRLIQEIQVTRVCRDSGHLYAYGIQFSQNSNQYLLASLAPNLQIDPTGAGGTSVVILSTVNYIGLSDCQTGGYTSTSCPNYGKIVLTNRLVIGNSALNASSYGTPTGMNAYGDIPAGSSSSSSAGYAAGYLNQASDVVTNFPAITLSTGSTGQQTAYISEMYSQSSGMNWFFHTNNWVNAVSFF